MMFYGGHMGGWGFALMTISGMLFWALIVTGVVLLVRCVGREGHASEQPPSPLTPEQLLAERFARGDIDQSEYVERLATLHGHARREPREPTAHLAARVGHVVREDSQGG
jgi:putative membrane protein